MCIVRRGHPTANEDLTLPVFLALSHLLVSPEDEGYGRVDAALAKLGRKRRLALTLPQMYAVPELIMRSDMVATLPEGVVNASGYGEKLVARPPPLDLDPVPFVISWHRRNDVHPAQRWLRNTISSLFAKPVAGDG